MPAPGPIAMQINEGTPPVFAQVPGHIVATPKPSVSRHGRPGSDRNRNRCRSATNVCSASGPTPGPIVVQSSIGTITRPRPASPGPLSSPRTYPMPLWAPPRADRDTIQYRSNYEASASLPGPSVAPSNLPLRLRPSPAPIVVQFNIGTTTRPRPASPAAASTLSTQNHCSAFEAFSSVHLPASRQAARSVLAVALLASNRARTEPAQSPHRARHRARYRARY